jgi:hypothetical protein
MNDDRLSAALHEQTPEPPRTLTGPEVRDSAPSGRRRFLPVVRSRRLELGLVAVAMVAVIGVVVALVAWPGRTTSAPPVTDPWAVALNAPCDPAAASPSPVRSGRVPSPGATPTGTPPTMIPLSALGPQAQQDKNVPGTGMYVMFPQTTQWQVFESGATFADEKQAWDYAVELVNVLRCAPTRTQVHPVGADALPATVFFHDSPGGGYADGSWRMLTVLGTQVLTLDAQATNDPPADGPGDAFLVSLVAAARDAAQGRTPTPVTFPRGQVAKPSPSGFLTLAELGTGWSLSASAGDRGTVAKPYVPGTDCATVYLTPADKPGQWLLYRGTQPEGDGEWLLNESITTLTPEGVAKARASLEAATACSKVNVLASGTGIAGDYLLAIRYKTEVGAAMSYVLSGTTLIALETLPGGAIGGVPLPGGTDWLTGVSARAVARATG